MALQLSFDATGDGPPVVILHGLFGSRSNWRSGARSLGTRHRVTYADRFTPYVEAMRSIDAAAVAGRTEVQRRLAERLPEPATAPFLMQNLINRNDHFDWRLNLAAIAAAVPALGAFPSTLSGRRFSGPTSLIRGGASDYVAASDFTIFEELFPAFCAFTIDGAGHWVHAEQPEAFLAALHHALGRVAP